jgi:hypothetical protein
MELASLAIREAYKAYLPYLPFMGYQIPIFDEFVNPSTILPIISLGNYLNPKAYIIMTNMTTYDASFKCDDNQNISIHLDINTMFDPNSGGYKLAEQIAGELKSKLFVNRIFQVTAPNINIWRTLVEGEPNIKETNVTNHIFRKILIINHSVQMRNLTT